MRTRIFFIVAALCLGGCQTGFKGQRETSFNPSLEQAIERGEKALKHNAAALSDVAELRRLDLQSRTLLEQLDYKAVKLLER